MNRLLSAITLLLVSATLSAEDFLVEVYNFRFEPEVLTIAPGDTVTWQNRQGVHNVHALDDSFTSGAPQGGMWSYSMTFNNEAPEIIYQDDANPDMQGAIIVETPFAIEYGITGSWYDVTFDGQGFSIEIIPGTNTLLAYWFTYTPDGEQMWLLGTGEIVEGRAELVFYRTEGGLFNDPTPPDAAVWGVGVFEFDDCRIATFVFASDDGELEGIMNLVRLSPNHLCAGS